MYPIYYTHIYREREREGGKVVAKQRTLDPTCLRRFPLSGDNSQPPQFHPLNPADSGNNAKTTMKTPRLTAIKTTNNEVVVEMSRNGTAERERVDEPIS